VKAAVTYLVEVVGVQVASIVDVAEHEAEEVVPSAGLLVLLVVVVIWKGGGVSGIGRTKPASINQALDR
jgi:hypothetical protein